MSCRRSGRGARRAPRRRPEVAAVVLVVLAGACGGETAPDPPRGIDARVGSALAPAELLGRYPEDPADQLSAGFLEGALGLSVGDGVVFVLDAAASSVVSFDLDARPLARAGGRGEGPGELSSPMAIAAGRDRDVWVADPAAGRLSRFDGAGAPIDEYRSAYPAVNFAVARTGDALLPTMNARTLLARVTSDGTVDLAIDPAVVPAEVSGGPADRASLRGLMLATLPDGSVAMLRNRHGIDFSMWRVALDDPVTRVEAVTPLPLPRWLYTMLEEETELVRQTVPEEFATGDFLVPFKGMHAVGGRLWLVPTPSSRAIAVSVPLDPAQETTVVVGEDAVYRGLIDAAVVGDRLLALYRTELRSYRLEEAPDGFTPPAGGPR